MERGILVPLDGTRFAEAALPPAIVLARRDEIALALVTIWQPVPPSFFATDHLEPWERNKEAQRHSYMDLVSQMVRDVVPTRVSVHSLKGRPADVLPRLPESMGQDLVVMATHGPGALWRMWLGSVADATARRSRTPVLLVGPEEATEGVALEQSLERERTFGRVLVPLDGSELAECALDRSVLVGSGGSIELTLLHVISFPTPASLPGIVTTSAPDGQVMRAERQAAQSYLDGVAERLMPWGCRVKTVVLEAVSIRRSILALAESEEMDLIAMASRGRGEAQRLLLGSVAGSVVRASKVPVLLFHPKRPATPNARRERHTTEG